MKRGPRFHIDHHLTTDAVLVIRDDGPHDICPTITNAPEQVVAALVSLGLLTTETTFNRQLVYVDSDGLLGELKHDGRRFTGFGPYQLPKGETQRGEEKRG